jgi:predicted enzyme related to lactoylglutathione lyase
MTATASPVLGRPLWYELMTSDMAAAEKFYDKVVGWTSEPFGGSPQPYTMFNRSEKTPVAGVMTTPKEMGAPPFWAVYVGVPKLEDGVSKIKQLGGSECSPLICGVRKKVVRPGRLELPTPRLGGVRGRAFEIKFVLAGLRWL